MVKVISIKDNQMDKEAFIEYISKVWANDENSMVYRDCIEHSMTTFLPNWYLLLDGDKIIGCAGIVPNDFISRMDLSPWLCSLYIEKQARGNNYGSILIERIKDDLTANNYQEFYLCTNLDNYYEKYGLTYFGRGFHPWGEEEKIYQFKIVK